MVHNYCSELPAEIGGVVLGEPPRKSSGNNGRGGELGQEACRATGGGEGGSAGAFARGLGAVGGTGEVVDPREPREAHHGLAPLMLHLLPPHLHAAASRSVSTSPFTLLLPLLPPSERTSRSSGLNDAG